MSFFDRLIAPATESDIRALVNQYAQGAKLKVTNWRKGGVSQQILETLISALYVYAGLVPKIVRGYAALDTSTDPGDADPYDAENANLTPSAGFLSNLGANTYGTLRKEATFANGYVTLNNTGPGARAQYIQPRSLVFTWTSGSPPSPAPTYTNVEDDEVYNRPGGYAYVEAGDSLVIPVECEVQGTVGSAPSGALSMTTTLIGMTATNASPVMGSDREDADAYRERCRQAASKLSFGGPGDAYLYFATKAVAGEALTNAEGSPVNINRVQVTQSSSTGSVTVYYGTPSGAPTSADIAAANANIEVNANVVPDAITFSGVAGTAVGITIQGSCKVKNSAGITAAAVKNSIVAALAKYFQNLPIGGFDQNSAGTGALYIRDIEAAARAGYPGLYDVRVTTPSTAAVSLSAGQIPVLQSTTADWTVTLV